jgi:predicted SprT family Zn-dependent metalloprotease
MLQQTTFSDQWRNTTGFPDEMTQAELHDAIKTYCEHVIGTEYSDVFDSISINDIDTIEISPQLKRAAGAIKYQQTQLGQNEITLTIAFNAYREWGWSDQFRAVIRHELVHVLQIVETDDADHGDRFQRLASKLETSKHCETFASITTHSTVQIAGNCVPGDTRKQNS